ncbi:MAG: AsmA family protein [Gammaproteobacteria bacterium]
MKKSFKIFGIILSIIILLMIIGGFLVFKFVDLNTFKPVIVAQVKKITGRTLTVSGDINWSFYPVLGVDFKNATLSNLPGFGDQPFVKADDVKIGVHLLPLLSHRIEIERLVVNGLLINLLKNRQGAVNWQMPTAKLGDKAQSTVSSGDKKLASIKQIAVIKLIDLRNITINWQDSQTGRKSKIDNLSLQAKDIREGELFPVNLSLRVNGAQTINARLIGNVVFTNNEVKISELNLGLNDNTITGNLDAVGVNKISTFDIGGILRPLNIKGELQSKRLRFTGLDLRDVKLNLQGQNGIINAPLTANMYDGGLQFDTQINVQQTTPNITVQYKYSNFNLASLAGSVYGVKNISGTGNIWGNITTHSFSGPKVISTLNGTTSFKLDNGVIQGVDAAYMIYQGRMFWYSAVDMLRGRTGSDDAQRRVALVPRKNTKRTEFGSITGANKITNGVMHGNLSINAPDIAGSGSGIIDLIKRYVDYRMQINSNRDLSDWAVPIIINGPFNDVKIKLDQAALSKMVQQRAAKAVQKRLQQKIKQDIKKLPIKIQNIF